ncbi:hypothetical protein [Paenibacillus sp. IHB B 3084]|nr:hypothetical protein [Paenibacillus sp. IHB B 3084]
MANVTEGYTFRTMKADDYDQAIALWNGILPYSIGLESRLCA